MKKDGLDVTGLGKTGLDEDNLGVLEKEGDDFGGFDLRDLDKDD